ncbi:MAG: hypothetical protein O3A51_12160 [Verrucomicrobia bacterium]|nr:hypothetical protein [Verrucomicrobiota bacterium]
MLMSQLTKRLMITTTIAGLCALSVQAADGNLRYSVTVSKFKNEAGWHGQWDLGDGFSTIMTHALNESGKFIVLGDAEMRQEAMKEQDLVASGRTAQGKKAPKIGRVTPGQLLVRGSITHVQSSTTGGAGGIGFKGIRVGGSGDSAEINMTIYLVDSETGQVKASTDVVGKSGRKGLSLGYFGSKLGGLTGNMAGFQKDNLGKATEDAVSQAVEFLIGQLDDIPWEGSIVLASTSKIVLNRGSRDGVSVGDNFRVGSIEELVDPDTGEVLDSEMTEIGRVTVTEVKEKIAYLNATSGADAIEKGMTVFPLD